jgi:hypothetical protein
MFSTFFSSKPAAANQAIVGEKSKQLLLTSSDQDVTLFTKMLDGFIDESKATFVIGQAHKFSAENLNADILYVYTDQRIDVLILLKYLFALHSYLLPANVKLHLSQKTENNMKDITDKPIQGTGKLALNHVEYARLIIQCAGFDCAIDTDRPHDIASHLRMKNEINLKKFQQLCNGKNCLQEMDSEIAALAKHTVHGKHDHMGKLVSALMDLRKNLASDIEASEKKLTEQKLFISPIARIAQETLFLIKKLQDHAPESADIKNAIHEYEKNCKKILGEDTYMSTINYYLFAPAQLSKDIDAIIKHIKVVTRLEEPTQEKKAGYAYIPFMKQS